jgi:ABC-type Zn uptake system ZnuABC Zn-binding protein ZnuA
VPSGFPVRDGRRLTRRTLAIGSALGAASLLSACVSLGGSTTRELAAAVPWLTVVTSTPVLADIVRAIGGSRVDVRTMMPALADPHRFVPGPQAGDIFVDADLLVQHGLGLEPGLQSLLDAGANGAPLVVATEAIPPDQLITRPAGASDPYVWHDPTLMPWVVSRLLRALKDADQDLVHRTAYDTNSVTFLNQIAHADAYLDRRLTLVPGHRRLLATADDTFAYLGRRYGLETIALLTDDVAFPTERDIERFASLLLDRQPVAAFIDASLSPTAMQAAILRAAASGPLVPIGGVLYGAGLGQGDTVQGRYLGLLRRNADRIVAALR